MTLETVRRLLRRHAKTHILNIFNKLHPADIAHLLAEFPLSEQQSLFDMIPDDRLAARILTESEPQDSLEIVSHLEVKRIAQIVQSMDSDDAADFIGTLPEEKAEEVLQAMRRDESAEVEHLLLYPPESAGGIMTTNVLAIREDLTIEEVIAEVRRASEVEMVFYTYVVDDKNHLLGVISLRELLLAEPDKLLREIMNPNVFSVNANADQEEVAKRVRRYDLLAMPVVDSENKLLGMVTVDDIIDVIYDEATEDFLRMAGSPGEDLGSRSIVTMVRKRAPWLLVSCIGGLVALQIISYFQASLNKLIALAAFIPIVMGMGGNVGGQSASIVIAGIATGRIDSKALWWVIFREVRVGFVLGFAYGTIVGIFANFQYAAIPLLGLTVGLSITGVMTIAATIAAFLPLILNRLNIDPAFATSPFIQVSMDIMGIAIYFNLANLLIFT
jgi:magnesium transporter